MRSRIAIALAGIALMIFTTGWIIILVRFLLDHPEWMLAGGALILVWFGVTEWLHKQNPKWNNESEN